MYADIELILSAYIYVYLRFNFALFPVMAASNLTPKHHIIVDVVENHNRDQNPNEHNHKYQGAGRSRRLVNCELRGNNVGENNQSQADETEQKNQNSPDKRRPFLFAIETSQQ